MWKSDTHDDTKHLSSKTNHLDFAIRPNPKLELLRKSIVRYRIEEPLGQGAFGTVYLAHDELLDRLVTLKIPHAQLIKKPEDAAPYIEEARTVASLDHPGIIPLLDVGNTPDFPCYLVSKYIEGQDLTKTLKQKQLNFGETVELISTVAETLHHAHQRGLVHRDVKPGNILLGDDGRTYLLDFGLALRDDSFDEGTGYAGTPAYMSPEQARCEGHRVDGRSDIYNLGIVLYEVLTGEVPFHGETVWELLDEVINCDPKPPRQHDEKIPCELERICLKAIAKKASERYSNAQEFAQDLRAYLLATSLCTTPLSASPSQPLKVLPRGLRSFDARDAAFFLELLPGSRDRNGLPDSLSFWKTRIEERCPENTFSAGLIYGPSGCGKSSFVKAGLFPHLSDEVIPIYVEASAKETEASILRTLQRAIPELPKAFGLVESFALLRRQAEKKVVVVIDQFEQWLNAHRSDQKPELVAAIRQCDGGNIQAILLVRDDFWMAASRFMSDVEVKIRQGINAAAIDLFPVKHAKKLLAAFGRAFGDLQDVLTRANEQFLERSVIGLAQDGYVISVRLALFAEMVKGKPWIPETLKEVGGAEGIGARFLDETFCGRNAQSQYRLLQESVREVLKALLPNEGTNIKGHLKSHDELRKATVSCRNPNEFNEILRVLDGELKLITPTDPDESQSQKIAASHPMYYQLTHDFLVPSIREWLARKQQETRRGRAENKLSELASLYFERKEYRQLPTPCEWINIRLLTKRNQWTRSQCLMMDKAWNVHVRRLSIAAVFCLLLFIWLYKYTITSLELHTKREAEQIVVGLLQADTSKVSEILGSLEPYRKFATNRIKTAFSEAGDESNSKLHAALALLPIDKTVLPFLKDRLLTVTPAQFPHVCGCLKPEKDKLITAYWEQALTANQPSIRFQAACALSEYDPNSENWNSPELCQFLAEHLTSVQPSELFIWRDALRPVKDNLIGPLRLIYREKSRPLNVRSLATDTLTEYLDDDPEGLFELLADSDQEQYEEVFRHLKLHRRKAIELAQRESQKEMPGEALDCEKERQARRQANSFILLVRLDAAPDNWSLLKQGSAPQTRSYLVHWLQARGINVETVVRQYDKETDLTIKRGLLLSLGEFSLSDAKQREIGEKLLPTYSGEADAGFHAAAEWLLRKWGHTKQLKEADDLLISNFGSRQSMPYRAGDWYINRQGQTFVVLSPKEFAMGSPDSELGRFPLEAKHQRRIERQIAFSAKEVTHGQWRKFSIDTPELQWKSDQEQLKPYINCDESPMIGMTWYEAAHYCNWLSATEGMPESEWCYQPNSSGEYAAGMTAKPEFWKLKGYRLPTEAEWEYACRGGTNSSRYYGCADDLLEKYAWYQANGDNHSHPVGTLKPNDFGLFDMYGNVYEWCYDPFDAYPALNHLATSTVSPQCFYDTPKTEIVDDKVRRVLRGGSFFFPGVTIRSASRSSLQPGSRPNLTYGGFRPVRTLN